MGLLTAFNLANKKIKNIKSFIDTLRLKSYSYKNVYKKLEDRLLISERYLATNFKRSPIRIPTDTTNIIRG